MERIIFFEENRNRKGVIRFVSDYRKKSFLRRERIQYTVLDIHAKYFSDAVTMARACDRIKKDYPEAKIYCMEIGEFLDKYDTRRFWVVCRHADDGRITGFFSNMKKDVEWTENIEDADIQMVEGVNGGEQLHIIRSKCKANERVAIRQIYLNLINLLRTPMFMITCTSKGEKQETKYFARIEGNRIRRVYTSDAATKFTYENVLSVFEYLKSHNKNFLYAILPKFKDNVYAKDIESYMKEKNVSRAVNVSLRLKYLNR